jgi:hypothetical protein
MMIFPENDFHDRTSESQDKMNKHTGNITELAHLLGDSIDDIANNAFTKYYKTLTENDITYIVYAIWGTSDDSDLTDIQKKMHCEINPVIKNIMCDLGIEKLDISQQYALDYLIRSLFISKISYMIEYFKKKKYELQSKLDFSYIDNDTINDDITGDTHSSHTGLDFGWLDRGSDGRRW